LETYPLKNEKQMKNGEYGNISEALWKHLGLDFLHGNNFFTQNSLNTSPGGSAILRTAPFSLFIGKKGRRLPPNSPRRARLLPP